MSDEELTAEFGVVAEWTADVVDELGPEYAIVAGCRGSGDPALLDWLAQACGVGPETALVDVGAGVGGAAAWVAETYGARPALVEPMEAACRAARRMFGWDAVRARGEALPFGDGQFDVAWCVGVLCTVHEKRALLHELARVLRPGGSLGMTVLVADPALHSAVPKGNEFPEADEVRDLIAGAGLTLRALTEAPNGTTPTEWVLKADQIDELLRKQHANDQAWRESEEQGRKLSHLLTTRQVTTRLLHATKSVGAAG